MGQNLFVQTLLARTLNRVVNLGETFVAYPQQGTQSSQKTQRPHVEQKTHFASWEEGE